MERTPVSSSNVHAIGYDAATRVLDVEFKAKGGKPTSAYSHADVPPEVWEGFMKSGSKGQYYAAHIKGKFSASKL